MKNLIIFLFIFITTIQTANATKFIPSDQADEKINYKNPTIEQLKSCDWAETSSHYVFNVVCREPGVKRAHLYTVKDDFIEPVNLHEKKRRKANESYKIQEEK